MTIVYMHYFGFVQGKGTCHLIYEMLSSQISALHIKTILRTLKKGNLSNEEILFSSILQNEMHEFLIHSFYELFLIVLSLHL